MISVISNNNHSRILLMELDLYYLSVKHHRPYNLTLLTVVCFLSQNLAWENHHKLQRTVLHSIIYGSKMGYIIVYNKEIKKNYDINIGHNAVNKWHEKCLQFNEKSLLNWTEKNFCNMIQIIF